MTLSVASKRLRRITIYGFLLASASNASLLAAQDTLPETKPLQLQGDLSAQMVSGIGEFLDDETEKSVETRKQFWNYDFSSREKFDGSVASNRDHLRKIIGAVDQRLPITALEYISDTSTPAKVAEDDRFTILGSMAKAFG